MPSKSSIFGGKRLKLYASVNRFSEADAYKACLRKRLRPSRPSSAREPFILYIYGHHPLSNHNTNFDPLLPPSSYLHPHSYLRFAHTSVTSANLIVRGAAPTSTLSPASVAPRHPRLLSRRRISPSAKLQVGGPVAMGCGEELQRLRAVAASW